MANIDPFGKLMQAERWISNDKLNRQQVARQNALQDIQQQSAQLGLEQKQGDAAFRNMLATNPQQAQTSYPLRHKAAFPKQDAAETGLKNKDMSVMYTLLPKIKNGTASQREMDLYSAAETNYRQPKLITDPVTGQQSRMVPGIPNGYPSFMSGQPETRNPTPTDRKTTPKHSGSFSIVPINDISKMSKPEIAKARSSIREADLMKGELKELLKEVKNAGGVRTLSPEKYADWEGRYMNSLMRYKTILELGVLNGPDISIMESILLNPASLKGKALGDKAVEASFNNVIKSLDRSTNRLKKESGGILGKDEPTTQASTIIKFDAQGNMIP